NNDIDWPKSVKLYKQDKDSLYVFGPVWDFDWGYGYALPPTRKLFVTNDASLKGCKFFYDIVRRDSFKELFAKRWEYFKTELLPQWLDYMDEYSDLIRISALQDGELWPDPNYSSSDFDNQIEKIKEWIEQRIELIDKDRNYMLY
ncbi:MAG: CotH kinase family protein, partial [Muribaculaceae bacterium]|nr:CotH kinase family protein [Muribaculaceae bacterium]